MRSRSALEARRAEILEANERDLEAGRESEIGEALLDRLALNDARIDEMAEGVRTIAALDDPVGEVIEEFELPAGPTATKIRVPLGVVAIVYEARPNVTIDAMALSLKAGNATVLRGSSSAAHSNAVLASVAAEAATSAGIPRGAIALVAGGGREELAELATQAGVVDLIVPRGGEGLKAALKDVATVPVIYAASGNCHVYVDASADLEAAERIVLNAKTQRPGHVQLGGDAAGSSGRGRRRSCRSCLRALDEAGRRAPRRRARSCCGGAGRCLRCGDAERGGLGDGVPGDGAGGEGGRLACEDAIGHVNRYGSGHSEAILTGDDGAARAFQMGVDAACVYVNASTRFTDGGQFGMGAEVGNSTQKLHARGPMGVARAVHVQVPGGGHGPRPPVSGGRSRRARRRRRGASTRRTSVICCCAQEARHGARARPGDADADRTSRRTRSWSHEPGAEHRLRDVPAGRASGEEWLEACRARARPRRPVVHGRYPAGDP